MIEVLSNGKRFSGWLSASVSRSLSKIAGSFSLSVCPTGGLDSFGIFAGDSVEIWVDRQICLCGYVDKISGRFSEGSHSVTVSGSERTSDLADCSLLSPLEWRDKDLAQIAGEICRAFGISFSNKNGVSVGEKFKKFSVEPGSRAVEGVSKLCRERGILICSDGLGNVSLLRPDSCPRGPALVQGENLLSASADYSVAERYSKYVVYGSGSAAAKVRAESLDSQIERPRTLCVVDANATEADKVQARADFERRFRIAKSLNFKCELAGWKALGGVWSPGIVCSVRAPACGISDPVDLLVDSVTLSASESGTKTELSLVFPGVYEPQPESRRAKGLKPGKADPWAAIRKRVKGK